MTTNNDLMNITG